MRSLPSDETLHISCEVHIGGSRGRGHQRLVLPSRPSFFDLQAVLEGREDFRTHQPLVTFFPPRSNEMCTRVGYKNVTSKSPLSLEQDKNHFISICIVYHEENK